MVELDMIEAQVMRLLGKPSVGLVLRSSAVEVVVVKPTLKGAQFIRHARVAFPPDSPEASRDQQVVQAIREALTTCEAGNARLTVSVPSKDVLLRAFTLPLVPKAERAQTMQFEVRKYIPFKIDQLVWNFHAVELKQEKQLSVVFVGIRKEAFERVQGWLKAAGVAPKALEALSVSVARLAGAADKAAQNTFIGLVDITEDTAHITIAKNHVPYLSRDFHLAAPVSPSPTQADQPSADDPRLARLLSELRLSFEFFTREHPGASIEKVLLFGEERTVAPWCAGLSEQLGCRVELGSMPVDASAGGSASLQFAAGVGVALRGASVGSMKLNFPLTQAEGAMGKQAAALSVAAGKQLLESLKDPEVLRSLSRPMAIQAGIAAVCLAVFWVLSTQQVRTARIQLEQTIQGYPDLGRQLMSQDQSELEKLKQQVVRHLKMLEVTIAERVSVAEKLDALATVLPEGIWLNSLGYQRRLGSAGPNQPGLNLQGACFLPDSRSELTMVSEFVQAMKQHPGFFRGFATAQISRILEATDPVKHQSYRTFRLDCS